MTKSTSSPLMKKAAIAREALHTFSWSQFQEPTPIARGTTTQIYRAHLDTLPLAIKLLAAREKLPPGPSRDSAANDLRNEALLNSVLRHPHVVHFLGVVQSPVARADPPGLVFEFADSVLDCEQFGPGKVVQAVEICRKVGTALAFAHEMGVLHRDVKPSQVLICEGRPKLGDWGLARGYVEGDQCTGSTGTWEYMAPEVIRSETYGERADVYSFGMVLFSVVCGTPYPYEDNYLTAVQAAMGVANNGLRPKIKGGVDECVVEIITKCWTDAPAQRPRMSEVVQLLAEARETLKKRKDKGGIYSWIWG